MKTRPLFCAAGLALVLAAGVRADEDSSGERAERPGHQKSSSATGLDAARKLYQTGDYAEAERAFARVADNARSPRRATEEARFFQADCRRLQGGYPAAMAAYRKYLQDFPAGSHRQEALKQVFDIANYWLDDTRAEMQVLREWREGQRPVALPAPLLHFDKGKPFFDEEGEAVRALEWVYRTDLDGPLAAKALWYAGNVGFFREAYAEADARFGELLRRHPDCEFAPATVELGITCKLALVGDGGVDGGRLAEARGLVQKFRREYPAEAATKEAFLGRMSLGIRQLEAERDYRAAERQERAGNLDEARARYEAVRRRYPGTACADQARQRLQALRPR